MPELLITGGHSFIGGAVRAWMEEASPEFHCTAVSLRGDGWKAMDFSRYDAVLHCAGIAHVSPDPSLAEQYDLVNHRLTAELAAKAKSDGVKQFIFLSSMIVFGEAAPAGTRRTISPDTPPSPANAYGQSKLDAENALHALADDAFRVAILRPPMVYGGGCRGNYNTLVSLARKLPVFPEFENRRSMLYVENLAELIRRIALDRAAGTFHPSDGAPRSVTDIVRAICAAHGKNMHFARALAPLVRLTGRGGIVRRAFGDMAYAPTMPDYPGDYRRFGFEEAIRRTEAARPW